MVSRNIVDHQLIANIYKGCPEMEVLSSIDHNASKIQDATYAVPKNRVKDGKQKSSQYR